MTEKREETEADRVAVSGLMSQMADCHSKLGTKMRRLSYEVRHGRCPIPEGQDRANDLMQAYTEELTALVGDQIDDLDEDDAPDEGADATQCHGTTNAGTQCQRRPAPGSEFCSQHEPDET